jgi:amino acid adenylation domain-containing protein/non-ribosomal peptide synthase protein (TIGR01720 family)
MSDLAQRIANLSTEKRALLALRLKQQGKGFNVLPLSFAQERLWFLDQLDPGNPAYHITAAVRLKGELKQEALQKSLDEIIGRHEVLRTRFATVEGRARQVVETREALRIAHYDLSEQVGDDQADELRRRLSEQAQLPFRLDRWPLLRVAVYRLAAEEHVLLVVMHHIVSDGWSMQVLIQELGRLYTAFAKGEPSPLAELPIQYGDYAMWQREWLRGEVLEEQLEYWGEQLGGVGAGVLELPGDRARPAELSHRGGREEVVLGEELTRELRELSRQYGVTMFMSLLAGFQALLWRYTGAAEVVVGAPIAGRNRVELEGLVGFFANTLALRVGVSGAESFAELLGAVKRVCLGAYEHQEIPFEKVVDELQLPRRLSHTPLFQVALALQNAPAEPSLKLPGLSLEPLAVETGWAKFDLELELTDTGETIFGVMGYRTDLFEAETIKRMVGHLKTLLQAAVANPQERLSRLTILTEKEQELLVGWSDTKVDYPADRLVHQLFEAQAEQTPEAVALIFGVERLTFGELNHRSNQLAHYLQSLGVGAEVPVGVCLERSAEMVIALLALLKAGGVFVPLSPDYPAERLAFMLADMQAGALLTTKQLLQELPASQATTVCLDRDWEVIAGESETNPGTRISPDNLAYIIYTSGSTGQPKGVMVEHRQLSSFVSATQSLYNFTPGDTMTCVVSFAFDVFLFQVLSPMLAGGTCLLVAWEQVLDMPALVRLLDSATVMHGPASLFHQIANFIQEQEPDHSFEHMRVVAVGGEFVAPELAQRLQRVFSAADVYVDYGPTEATMVCTNYLVPRNVPASKSIIGKAFPNARTRLYDAYLNLVPVGVPGEIFLGGACVSRGYLHRPELTAEKYPFIDQQRFYRTGDVGRYLADGNIEFLGRMDEQVKVRGYRIELGEIESVLSQHASVQRAVVIAQQHQTDHKRLVAFVVTDSSEQLAAAELRQFLRRKLPDYMVPAAFITLDELPLTPNGKVDRRQLAQMDFTTPPASARDYVEARTAIEQTLVEIWQQVLGLKLVGVHDNFFELGGDSILSIQIVARANQAGLRLTTRQLFEHQTVAELAEVAGTAAAVSAEQGAVSGRVSLTPVQRSFFAKQQPEPEHFNQSLVLRISEPRYTAAVLREAMKAVVAQHDALRLRFRQSGEGWEEFNAALEENDFFRLVDLRHFAGAEQAAALEADAARQQASLDLSAGPLLRVCYYELGGEEEARLLLVIHHLAVDGVSWRILLEDVASGCEQAAAGKDEISLGAKTTSYKEWAERLRAYAQGDEVRDQGEYWRGVAARARQLKRLPVDYEEGENTVGAARAVEVSLTREETTALLSEVPAVYRTEINEVLLTALVTALGRWTGERRVVVELEGHGREEIGEEVDVTRTVGWFTTFYPVLLEVDAGAGVGEALKAVKEQVRRVPERGLGWGLWRWLRETGEEGDGGSELEAEAELSFNYLGQFDHMLGEGAAFVPAPESAGSERSPRGRRSHLLEIVGSVFDGRLQLSWTYDTDTHRRETIDAVAHWYMEALRNLIEHCRSPQAGGFTPSDFSKMKLSQEELDELVDDLSELVENE